MENEILLLREENTRLKNIIASLAGKILRIEKALYANDENNNGENNLFYADDKIIDLINKAVYSNENKMDGVKGNVNANDKNNDGVNHLTETLPEKNVGVNPTEDATRKIPEATKQPESWKVENSLRKIMVTASYSGIENTAKILIQLHAQPRNSYKELRKLTGLSEDGLTKRIMAMKKKGLVVRTSFQYYSLTEMAIKILNDAMV